MLGFRRRAGAGLQGWGVFQPDADALRGVGFRLHEGLRTSIDFEQTPRELRSLVNL